MRARTRRVAAAWIGLTFSILAVPVAAEAGEPSGIDLDLVRKVTALIGVGKPAEPSPTESSDRESGDDQSVGIGVDRSEQSAAVQYWTRDRMLGAVSGDTLLSALDLSQTTATVERGVATILPGIPVPQASLDLGGLLGGLGGGGAGGSIYGKGGAVMYTSGKVFFTMNGTDYVCSGSSTAAANHSLVLTAAHCVYDDPGYYSSNFVFVPAYQDGRALFGVFPARSLYVTNQWAARRDLSYDVGVVVVSPVNGQYLADTVGAQGIAFNLARGAKMYAFGYPATGRYDGSKLAWCSGVVSADTQGTADQGMKCNMTGGSSGGPWFIDFSESNGAGTLNSLNSFKYTSLGLLDGGSMYGPYFGSDIQALYDYSSVR
jgi:V8-like Glu-specific endopeptidase